MKKQQHQLMQCKYDYIAYAWDDSKSDSHNYIVVQNDKFGKVTKTGDEIFPCIYDGITTWVEYGPPGHYVRIGDRMGLIDYNGKIRIPIKYDKVHYIFETIWAEVYDKNKVGLYDLENKSFLLPLEYDYIYVDYDDWLKWEDNKPKRIITYKDGIVNILDETGKIIQEEVSKAEIKREFEINIDSYQYSPCSYELHLMVQNKTFQPPSCLLEQLNEYDQSVESVYYKMEER